MPEGQDSIAPSLLSNKTDHYKRRLGDPVDPAHRPHGIRAADFVSLLTEWRTRHNMSQ